jgi:hypothetical protein
MDSAERIGRALSRLRLSIAEVAGVAARILFWTRDAKSLF